LVITVDGNRAVPGRTRQSQQAAEIVTDLLLWRPGCRRHVVTQAQEVLGAVARFLTRPIVNGSVRGHVFPKADIPVAPAQRG
jgi:hypothetical protein